MLLTELLELRATDPCSPISADTLRHYRRTIRQFGEFLEREPTTDDLNADTLMSWANKSLADGLSPATANSRVKNPRALWDWAARKRIVEEFPPKGLGVREPARLPDAWTPAELSAIFRACEKQEGWIGPQRASEWMLAYHWWLYNTGERFGATMRLRPDMIDLEAGQASVPFEIRKGKMRSMVYKLSNRCRDALSVILPRCDERLFDSPWEAPRGVYPRYRRLIADAGIKWVRHKSGPQKMRRTVATYVKSLGGEPAFYLGHAARNTAEESYIDRGLLMAHDHGLWPRDDLDPLSPKPFWARLRLFG